MIFLAGLIAGALLLWTTVEVAGGWYVYDTVPEGMCRSMPPAGEIVPHQPNPCHVRYRRWRLLY